ncbi:hypothetical protein DIPPA_34634 [Diplonema papillatum]|nr:hypothetical protein DIPPA_34634 [Diplonema papillatum]
MKYGDHDSVVAAAQDAAASGISIRTVVRVHKMEEVDSFFQSLGKDTPQAFHHGTAVSVYAERKPAS